MPCAVTGCGRPFEQERQRADPAPAGEKHQPQTNSAVPRPDRDLRGELGLELHLEGRRGHAGEA